MLGGFDLTVGPSVPFSICLFVGLDYCFDPADSA